MAAYSILALIVVATSIIFGFRCGFKRQISRVISVAFGIVCAHIFNTPVSLWLSEYMNHSSGTPESDYLCSTLSGAAIFITIYVVFRLATCFLSRIFRNGRETGIMDKISGALFSLFFFSLLLSIGYNMLVCFEIEKGILKSVEDGDGNIVGSILSIAPAVLDSESPEELAHQVRLREAKKIS